ncbi:MAG: YlqD family protein [Desulfotomaculum sp.]|nr:YlqD family protein [Desulfotomaculum sp.]
MQSITITRPVIIKVKVTESYKKTVVLELQKSVQRLETELQQLEFQNKKLSIAPVKPNQQEATVAKQQIQSEIAARWQKKQNLLQKIKAVGQLTPGIEVVHGRVESLVELKPGDDWNKVMNVEILIEAGKVLEIRSIF